MSTRIVSEPRLLPVVELFHFYFDDPEGIDTSTAAPHDDIHWKKMERLGLASAAHFPGSHQILTEKLTDPQGLLNLLRRELSQTEEGLPLPHEGGFILYDGEDCIIEPQCCGSLKDLVDWREAADLTEATQPDHSLWIGIGHPGLSYRRQGDVLYFESAGPEESDLEPFLVDPHKLGIAVKDARAQLMDFFVRLRDAAKPLIGRRATPFCKALVGRKRQVNQEGW